MREYRHAGGESMQHKETTTMGVCWMLVILLCVSSHATEHPYTNVSVEQLEIYWIPKRSHVSVFVPCPNVTADDKMYKLYKEQINIHNCQLPKDVECKAGNGTKLSVRFENKDNSPGFTVNVTSQGIYTCRAETIFPPPFQNIPSEKLIIVLKEGHSFQDKKISCDKKDETKQMFPLMWITLVALLCTYSVAATIKAAILWFKLRSTDSQNDYENAKPVAHRQRKNKNKVQNPIPLYL